MTRVALAGLLRRKLRASLTAIAIVLGVAMIAGTLVLTDSIDQAFNSIFTDVRQGSDVVVSGKSAFDLGGGSGTQQPTLGEPARAGTRAPDVREAEGSVNGEAQLIGKNGKAIVYGGAPNLGFSIANPISPFNPLTLVSGAWPKANEVVVDKSTAGKEHLEVGQLDRGPGRRAGDEAEDLGDRQVRVGGDDRGRDPRGLRPPDRPEAVRQAPSARRDRDRREDGRVGPGAAEGGRARSCRRPPRRGRRQQQAKKDAEDTDSFISFLRTSCSRSAGSPSSSAAS